MLKSLKAFVVVLASVGLLVGCSASNDAGGWSTPKLADNLPAFTAADSLPFDAYHRSDADLEAIQRAEAELLNECAQNYGVDVTYGGDYIRPTDDSRTMWGGRLGTLDEARASQYGYHASPESPWAPVGGFYIADPSNIQPVPDANGEISALVTFGPEDSTDSNILPADAEGEPLPEGGCLAQVEATLGGSLISDNLISAELINLSLAHEQVKNAISEWSECMRAAGYEYDTVQGPAEKFSLTLISSDEIKTAVTDVRCTTESRWADVFYAVLSDYQNQAIARHPDDLDAVLASQTARLTALSIE